MAIIRIPHPSIEDGAKTYLTSSLAAAGTTATVQNTEGFANTNFVLIGEFGQDKTELETIGAAISSATSMTISAVSFAHENYTPITYVKYNQFKVYLGDYSTGYSTGTIDINHNSYTLTGNSTSWGSITTAYALLLNGEWYDISSKDSATQITLKKKYTGAKLDNASYILVPFTVQTTANLEVSEKESTWDDTDAVTEDYYRYSYYDNTTGVTFESEKSVPISARDLIDETIEYDEYSLYKLSTEILEELNDLGEKQISRDQIKSYANGCQRDLVNSLIKINQNYLIAYTTVNLIADVAEYTLPDDFKEIYRVQLDYTGSDDYWQAKPERLNINNVNVTYVESEPYYVIRDRLIEFYPTPTTAVTNGAKIWYKKIMPVFKNAGDIIPFYLQSYKELYKTYIKAQIRLDQNSNSQYYALQKEYVTGKDEMLNQLQTSYADRNPSVVDIEFED